MDEGQSKDDNELGGTGGGPAGDGGEGRKNLQVGDDGLVDTEGVEVEGMAGYWREGQ